MLQCYFHRNNFKHLDKLPAYLNAALIYIWSPLHSSMQQKHLFHN